MSPMKKDKGDIDEVAFRELLAQMFPSKFADEQVAKAKSNVNRRKRARGSRHGKAKKVPKEANDSDASSRASYEDCGDGSSNSSSSGSEHDDAQSDNQDVGSLQMWKVEDGKVVMVPFGNRCKTSNGDSCDAIKGTLQCIVSSAINKANGQKARRSMYTLESDSVDSDEDEDYDPDEQDSEDEDVSCDESDSVGESDEDDEDDEDASVSDGGLTLEVSEISDASDVTEDADTIVTSNSHTPLRRSQRIKNREGKKNGNEDIEGGNRKRSRNGSKSAPDTTLSNELDDTFIQEKLNKVPKAIQGKCQQHWKRFKEHIEKERTTYESNLKKKEKKEKRKNLIEFKKLLREGSHMDDLRYFNRVLCMDEQRRLMKEMEEVKSHYHHDVPYRLRLLDAPIPPKTKAVALRKINSLHKTSPGDGEYHKLKKWVDAFMRMPFGNHSELSLTLADGKEKCHEFMLNAKRTLDETVFGLDDAKLQIMQMLGQWISNPSAIGSSLAIHGPMGTGKTTLVKEGISKILGREFVFIALGGATDSSFLEGHSYTYEGSTWGKIVDCIMQCKTMNPVIYFDELDKVSDSARGEEIIGILTHLTDTSQNDKFHDKYFSEVEFDLSKCLFIFSYNDPDRVNPILRDRMYTIKTNGYSIQDKVTIAKDYLLPSLLPQVGFSQGDVTIPEEIIQFIAKEYTDSDEKGVRSLKRCLEIILTKLNLFRLLNPGTVMFGQTVPDNVQFPVTVDENLVRTLLKKKENDNKHWVMYS